MTTSFGGAAACADTRGAGERPAVRSAQIDAATNGSGAADGRPAWNARRASGSSSQDRQIAEGTDEHIVDRAADRDTSAARWHPGSQPGRCATSSTACAANASASTVSACRGSRTSVDAATMRKPTANATSKPTPCCAFVGDGESDVGAGGQRQQQRRELAEPQLGHQAIGRRRRDQRRADGVPREPDRQPARRDGDRAQAFSHDGKYSWSTARASLRARDIDEIERVDAVRRGDRAARRRCRRSEPSGVRSHRLRSSGMS